MDLEKIVEEDRVHPKFRGTPLAPILRVYYNIEDHQRANPPWYTPLTDKFIFRKGTNANIPLAVYLGGGQLPSESERNSQLLGKDKQFLARWHARIVNPLHAVAYAAAIVAIQNPDMKEWLPTWIEIPSIGYAILQTAGHAANTVIRNIYHHRNPEKAGVCVPTSVNSLLLMVGAKSPDIAAYGMRQINNGKFNGANAPQTLDLAVLQENTARIEEETRQYVESNLQE